MERITLGFLGGMAARTGEGRAIPFRTDKIRALLAYLLLEGERPHQRQTLAALLWPEMTDALALKNLRQSLHRLQQALVDRAPALRPPLLVVTRQTVECRRPDWLAVDVHEFQALLAASEAHPHRVLHLCPDCLQRLARATELYQGELLAGFGLPDATGFEEWLLFWRERLQQQMIGALGNLARAYAERGETEPAWRYAARLVQMDPFREEAHRQLMRLYALRGEHARALVQFENCRRLLWEELGIAPAAETTALYRQIVAEQRGEGPAVAVKKPAVLHHFPMQFTPFVGREQELGQIELWFLEPDNRLLTLAGPGGMGKTRLSLRAAELLAERGGFTDGIYFIPLAAASTGEALLTALLKGLGVDASARSGMEESLRDYLRDRQCLLVLDNFEQLAAHAALLGELLAGAPGLRLLVTSHVALQLQAERRLPLEGLDYPAEDEAVPAALEYSAVRLFGESARHAAHGFKVTEENVPAILAICRLLQGAPLALELAAAWVRVMDCQAIVGEINRSLDFLSLSPQDRPERQQSMAAVFAYSWELMSAEEQQLLAQLAVFRGPFSLEAAMEITAATPLVVARLLDRSLLQRRRDGRYELHELLRHFVSRQAAGRDEQTARRHCAYYLELTAAQEQAFYGPQPRLAVAAVQAELSNVRQAWQWATANGYRPAMERSLEAMGRFYQTAALIQEGEAMFSRASEGSEAAPRLLIWQAYFLSRLSRRAEALSLLGELLARTGENDAAKEHQRQAIAFFQATSDLGRLARSLRRMVLACWRSGENEEALRTLQQALPIHQAIGEKRGLAQLNNLLAGIHYERNDVAAALSCVQEAQRLYEAVGDRLDAAVVAANLARLYSRLGQFEQALASNQQAIAISQELGDRSGLTRDLNNRGHILAALGEFEESLTFYYQAIEIARALDDELRIAEFQASVAAVYAAQGDADTALAHYELALPALLAQGVPYHLAGPLLGKVELLIERGELAEARALHEQAETLAAEAELPEYLWRARLLAARLEFAAGDKNLVIERLTELLAAAQEESERAELNYELWRMTGERRFARAAAEGYRAAHARVPSHAHRRRLDTLQQALATAGDGDSGP